MSALLQSTLTCPACGHKKEETMPVDACQYFYECENCKKILKPKPGDCCVYCSYGSVPCPPVQEKTGKQNELNPAGRLKTSGLKRIDTGYLKQELRFVFHLEKGFLFTVKEMLLRPGKTIQTYLFDNRGKYVKPVPFVILVSIIYTLAIIFFQEGRGVETTYDAQSSFITTMEWADKNWGYATLIVSFLMAFWLKLFFRKKPYNYIEILIASCYINGMLILFSALGEPMQILIIKANLSNNINLLFLIPILLYMGWAITKFFNGKTAGFFKGLLSYFLGVLTFHLLSALLIMAYQKMF